MNETILIVDDDTDIVEATTSVLVKKGYKILQAFDGKAALDVLQDKKPDLIITDVLMPEVDGFCFYKKLKLDVQTRDIAVLIISGRGLMEDTFRVLGVDDFIVKPFSPEALIFKIEEVLSRRTSANAKQQNEIRPSPFRFR